MSCGISMVKYILFLFNLLVALCGILMIIFGSLLFTNVHSVDDFKEAIQTQQVPITLIVLGSVVFLIAFFGCCGALRESYCMSMTYSVLLFLLMIAQLAFVAYMWMHKDKYLQYMGEVVDKAWDRRTRKADFMDALQISMECCGKTNFTDYNFQGYYPASCCKDGVCHNGNHFTKGCKRAFVDFWDTNSDVIKFAGLIIAAIEFVGFVFACCLANSIRNYERRSAY